MKLTFKRLIKLSETLLLFVVVSPLLGQLTEIESKLPKSVPMKVEFKNYDKETWWHDLEIEVTNNERKPFYYLDLGLWLDITNDEGKPYGLSLSYGDTGRFFSATNGETANPGDPAILPGQSYIFKIGKNYVKNWDIRKNLGRFVEPHHAELTHGWTNFGDGTGLLPSGTPWRFLGL